MKLVTAIMARNEMNTRFERVLDRCNEFSDRVIVLNDNSTDDTAALAEMKGCKVITPKSDDVAWGNETPKRKALWELAAFEAQDGWVLFCDADMLLQGDPRPYCHSLSVNAWSFVLYDLWDDEEHYRVDGHWQGHLHPRPWLFRPSLVTENWTPEWGTAGIHSGHAPPNFPYMSGNATDLSWHHLAYVTEGQRVKKHAQYMSVKDQLTEHQLAHAESILD